VQANPTSVFSKNSPQKVLVGLSGGVDSSVTALLLKEQGYAVTGVTMSVYDGPPAEDIKTHGNACYDCSEAEDIAAATALTQKLDIPYHVFDCTGQYKKIVLDYFRSTYLAGQTPNPCVRCNHRLKFGVLPELARQNGLDYDYFATGHYAQVEFSDCYNKYVLRRGADAHKDQSYFLYRLDQAQLSHALFPLGAMHKQDVRAIAAKYGLAMHDKPDSQDFFGGEYTQLLGMNDLPGNIIDRKGNILGSHNGYWHFTPGQRKGLGVAAAEPLYVLEVNAERNEVLVGPYAQSLYAGCLLDDLHINIPLPEAGRLLQAKMRSAQKFIGVTVERAIPNDLTPQQLEIHFNDPQTGVAPGQSLVLYLDDLVIGGGIIKEKIALA
jgi:tRNA-specific 2-thiouridylase